MMTLLEEYLNPVPTPPGVTSGEIVRRAMEFDGPPREGQEAFQFLLATAMQEAGKLELLNVADVDGRWHYTFSGAGEVFSVVRPEMSKEMERKVQEEVKGG